MREPIDVATRVTATFIGGHVPTGAEILEIGCGEGHVAAALQERGYQVAGVDSDPEAVAVARKKGVRALEVTWPEYSAAPVDAVVFTRSLHHIPPLQEAIRKARNVLRPGGRLLVEDFAFDQANAGTIRWLMGVLDSPTGRRLVVPAPGEFVTNLLESRDPEVAWHQDHDHELHSEEAMTRAVAGFFAVQAPQEVPYLFRYLVPALPKTPEASKFVEDILREEAQFGERGEIRLLGRRLVGSPKEDPTG